MNRLILTPLLQLLLLLILAIPVRSHALPAEVEVDQLLYTASTAIEKKDFTAAVTALEKAQDLKARLPVNFQYHYATALYGMGRLRSAKGITESYLEKYGKKAKYYTESIALLTNISASLAERRKKYEDAQAQYDSVAAEREQGFQSCVKKARDDVDALPMKRRLLANAEAETNSCWDYCNKNYCTETRKPPYDRCRALQRNYEGGIDIVRNIENNQKNFSSAETSCREDNPLPPKPPSLAGLD